MRERGKCLALLLRLRGNSSESGVFPSFLACTCGSTVWRAWTNLAVLSVELVNISVPEVAGRYPRTEKVVGVAALFSPKIRPDMCD